MEDYEQAEEVQFEEAEEALSIHQAIQEVIKRAGYNEGLLKGINEAARAIDRGDATFCFLADDCELNDYKRLIKALCTEKGVPVVAVSGRTILGEWAGLCKIDLSGTARKVVKCSCAVVTHVDEDSNPCKVLRNYINEQA